MHSTHHYILRLSGEVSIKAKRTRQRFTKLIAAAVKNALDSERIPHRVQVEWSRIFVESDERAAPILERIFGLQSVSPAQVRPWNSFDDVVSSAVSVLGERVVGKKFAVRAKRTTGQPRIPFSSPEVERAVGAELFNRSSGVDLKNPEVTVGVEVHSDRVYLYSERYAAPGGLPMGSEGRALALISGGYDSAVAAWELWKRGVALDFVFFNLGGAAHQHGVDEVLSALSSRWAYGDWPRLHSIDLRPQIEILQAKAKENYWQLGLKLLMMTTADKLAHKLRLPALITGEALGQVSSQTLPNLRLLDECIRRPIFRPLLTWNKDAIVAQARHIGTYAASSVVPEFCALAAKSATTKGAPRYFSKMVAAIDHEALDDLVRERQITEPRMPQVSVAVPGPVSADEFPEGATVIDLRSRPAFDDWHWDEALHLEYFQALKVHHKLDPEQRYVLYCEVGLKSAHLAELLQARGVEAHHVPKGVRSLRKTVAGG